MQKLRKTILLTLISLLLVSSLSAQYIAPVNVYWDAVGDNGSSGLVSAYDVRYSTDIITPETWYSLPQCDFEIVIQPPLVRQDVFITLPRGSYYIAVKAGDEIQHQLVEVDSLLSDTTFITFEGRNWSEISNVMNCTFGIDPPVFREFK